MHEHIHGHEYSHEHAHTDENAHGHTHSHTQTKAVLNRLSRIIGHLESVKRMVADGRDCSEVLVQLAAVDSAVKSVSRVVMKDTFSIVSLMRSKIMIRKPLIN